jgi:hypothetical protein
MQFFIVIFTLLLFLKANHVDFFPCTTQTRTLRTSRHPVAGNQHIACMPGTYNRIRRKHSLIFF